MRVGNLRHHITFQKPKFINDTWGHGNPSWTNERTAWVSIWPMRGNERLESMQLKERVTHKIRARYMDEISDIDTGWRIKFVPKGKTTARYFDIRAVPDVDERNIYFDILAEEIRN